MVGNILNYSETRVKSVSNSPISEYMYILAIPILAISMVCGLYLHLVKIQKVLSVKNELSNLETSLVKAESAERGYVLTGQQNYSEEFDLQLKLFWARENELCTLLNNVPGNKELCNQLQKTANTRIEDLTTVMTIAKQGNLLKAQQTIRRMNGPKQMEDIQNILNDIWVNNLER